MNATCSLSDEAKQTPDLWSVKSGISRSRSIRNWLKRFDEMEFKKFYLSSEVD